jgi:hypothetical protein
LAKFFGSRRVAAFSGLEFSQEGGLESAERYRGTGGHVAQHVESSHPLGGASSTRSSSAAGFQVQDQALEARTVSCAAPQAGSGPSASGRLRCSWAWGGVDGVTALLAPYGPSVLIHGSQAQEPTDDQPVTWVMGVPAVSGAGGGRNADNAGASLVVVAAQPHDVTLAWHVTVKYRFVGNSQMA